MARQQLRIEMPIARRVAPVGMTLVGWRDMLSGQLSFGQIVHIVGTCAVIAGLAFGVRFETPSVSILACIAILLLGLPHGTFDLALIRQAHANQATSAVVALYLGCAALMYALWQSSPVFAFSVFFVLSVVHFAEDWGDRLPPFFAIGTSVALLTVPVLLQRDTLAALFGSLMDKASAETVITGAILVAPVALVVVTTAIVALWQSGHQIYAISTSLVIFAMAVAPPIIGFALYFCLFHSPMQFSAAQRTLGWHRPRQWAWVVLSLTIAALALAGFIFAAVVAETFSSAIIATVFMTLSVLTLPHMAVPMIVARLSHYRPKSV